MIFVIHFIVLEWSIKIQCSLIFSQSTVFVSLNSKNWEIYTKQLILLLKTIQNVHSLGMLLEFITTWSRNMKLQENTSKRLTCLIETTPTAKWDLPTPSLSRTNQIKQWPCTEPAQDFFPAVITHISISEWNILEQTI